MLKNLTKKTVISSEIKTVVSKTKGLLGKEKPEAIIFKTRFGIHTFFLKFPIDVLILDKNKKVVAKKIELSPNRLFLWNPKFSTVLELPSESIIKSRTEIGDILEL